MKKIFKNRLATIGLLLAMLTATVGPMFANTTAFTDVPTDFWAYEQINRCVQDGIVSGYNDGTFKPGNPVSYGAFSIMLARAFYASELAGYSDQGTATGEAIMNKHGILNGTSRSSASIGASLPREDMAQCMYNVLVDKGAKIPSNTEYLKAMGSISDFYSISPNCRRAVMVCYTTGLLGGQSDGSFGPKNPMNRAQGCVVINRLRDYFQNNGGTTDPATPTVTELPAFKLQDGETVQQMMTRIMAHATYTPGYLSNGQPITEDNIKALLAEIEKSMPEDTSWDEDSRYFYNSNKFGYGGGCNSWGYAVSDYLFGKNAPLTKHQNFDQLKVGDMVWMKDSTNGYNHVFIITSLTNPYWGDDFYSNCSGNSGDKVTWSGHGTYTTLNLPEVTSGTYIYSRY